MESTTMQYVSYGVMVLLLIGLVWIYFSFSKRLSDAELTMNRQSDAIARLITGGAQPPPSISKKKDPPKSQLQSRVETLLEDEVEIEEVHPEDDQMTEKTYRD